jgi:hypothetical protein
MCLCNLVVTSNRVQPASAHLTHINRYEFLQTNKNAAMFALILLYLEFVTCKARYCSRRNLYCFLCVIKFNRTNSNVELGCLIDSTTLEDGCILGCCAVKSGRSLLTTTQKTAIFIFATLRTPDLT